jgi:hypothetical protein
VQEQIPQFACLENRLVSLALFLPHIVLLPMLHFVHLENSLPSIGNTARGSGGGGVGLYRVERGGARAVQAKVGAELKAMRQDWRGKSSMRGCLVLPCDERRTAWLLVQSVRKGRARAGDKLFNDSGGGWLD